LSKQTTRLSNRLRAVLLRYYPAALQVFTGGLKTLIAPQSDWAQLVLAYPSPQAAQALTYAEFESFAQTQRYPNPKKLPGCFVRLQANYPPSSSDMILVYQNEAKLLAHLLLENTRAKVKALADLQHLYRQHPNYATFASLPGMGELIGPGQLAKFGDDPQRFPHPSSVQALAGTCPVTSRSGKRRTVKFRRSCDKAWHLCHQWAMALVHKSRSPIALAYYERIRPHCHSNSHAYRCLANRWLAVAWKLWQTGQTYDQAYHFQQRTACSKPRG
jgi:hypothetical protein